MKPYKVGSFGESRMAKSPAQWNCPHCNEFYDSEKQFGEEYTVSPSYPDFIPHIQCPKCKECMGCNK
jgi:hypothetical protein